LSPSRDYGSHPDIPDHRDKVYLAPAGLRRHLPRSVDLRAGCPPVYNQGRLNSCSAHAIGAALWFDALKHGVGVHAPSRLFIYYNERSREKTIHRNATVSLRDGYKSVARAGACAEHLWPYRVERFKKRPPLRCYHAAKEHRAILYRRIARDLQHLKGCLAEGYPFTVGLSVFKGFEGHHVKRTGRVELPERGESLLGGHAVLVVGYDDKSERFLVRNSWGRGWGMGGYFTIPYAYAFHKGYSWDYWTVRRVL
jgi:C1A family cysteine protease